MSKKPAQAENTAKSKKISGHDAAREQNVLLEKIHSDIKTIGEGHGFLLNKVDNISEKVDKMDTTLRKVDSSYFKIEFDVLGIKSRLDTVDLKIDGVEKELGTVKNAVFDNSRQIKENSNDIKELKNGQQKIMQKLDIVIINHEQRLQKLEAIK